MHELERREGRASSVERTELVCTYTSLQCCQPFIGPSASLTNSRFAAASAHCYTMARPPALTRDQINVALATRRGDNHDYWLIKVSAERTGDLGAIW